MNFKQKLFASLVASSMMFGTIAPVFAEGTQSTATVEIDPKLEGHNFKAYQIFKGEYANTGAEGTTVNTLSNIKWGDNIDKTAFAAKLKAAFPTATFDDSKMDDASYVAEKIAEICTAAYDSDAANKVARAAYESTTTTVAPIDIVEPSTTIPAGYYLILDTTTGESDFKNPSVLQVVGNITISAKTSAPTVDKRVLDETADKTTGDKKTPEQATETGLTGKYWNESADHNLFEEFKFKLTADIPSDVEIKRYTKYPVTFMDSWSTGVTFNGTGAKVTPKGGSVYNPDPAYYDGIDSVAINITKGGTTTTKSLDADDYSLTLNNNSLEIKIDNLKDFLDADQLEGCDYSITVIYKAYLNENAVVVGPGTHTDSSTNDVYLKYANNPEASGQGETKPEEGKTEEDTVFVFTYEMPNYKVDDTNAPLEGAGFKLYSDQECNNEIKLVKVADGKYRVAKSTEDGVEMFSKGTNATFHIDGLDTGFYYLKETSTPTGFNTAPVTKVHIAAEHKETADATATTTMKMYVNNSETELDKNTIQNNKGTVLPETGGMGTTIFYTTGLILTVGAGVLLITKKRMNGEA